MLIDKMDAFKALDHYEIRVARSKYVDSAEDAIAFAERRNAPDPRLVPITLRTPAGASERHLESEESIRSAYDRLFAKSGRLMAQVAVEPGTDIVISGEVDEKVGKTITVQSSTHSVRQMVPIDPRAAETLVRNFQGYHHQGSREQARRMLEHLFEKLSKFFEETPVTRFVLDVRLHENSYTVMDAEMTSPHPLHLKERLDPRAHDRKGDEFHPAGRQ